MLLVGVAAIAALLLGCAERRSPTALDGVDGELSVFEVRTFAGVAPPEALEFDRVVVRAGELVAILSSNDVLFDLRGELELAASLPGRLVDHEPDRGVVRLFSWRRTDGVDTARGAIERWAFTPIRFGDEIVVDVEVRETIEGNLVGGWDGSILVR